MISEAFDLLWHINDVALFIHRQQLRKNLDMLSYMWFQQGYMENIMDLGGPRYGTDMLPSQLCG